MERIASFSVDHNVLEPGIYVSRSDADEATGCITTTFDLRNDCPKSGTSNGYGSRTCARASWRHFPFANDAEWKDRVIYFWDRWAAARDFT